MRSAADVSGVSSVDVVAVLAWADVARRVERIAAQRAGQSPGGDDAARSIDERPSRVEGREIDAVRESWLVEDRWWTGRPVRRRYWEVVTTCGRNVVVFHELEGGGWFLHRG